MAGNTALAPVVMAMSGSDPTGGAGIQADIETLASLGCHAAPVITSITVQNTINVQKTLQIDERMIIEQARAVLEDMDIAAIKIGLISSVETAGALHALLMDHPDLPVVLDPVICAGGGKRLADDGVVHAINTLLTPLVNVMTPNSLELKKLAPEGDTLEACAMAVLERGAHYVLVTDVKEDAQQVHNTLYANHRMLNSHAWPRLPEQFHGSGCTLAAAIAGLLAHGQEVLSAIYQAQDYTWKCLQAAHPYGKGQKIPNRFYWVK